MSTLKVLLLSAWLGSLAGAASAQSTQAEAFNDGRAFKSQTPALKNAITAAAIDKVPGQDSATTNELKGLYGSPLTAPGQSKLAACAAYSPGTDAYKNAECDTINYVSGNPEVRPKYTIDRINDPVIIRSTNVQNMPEQNTKGTAGLTGTYTACTNKTNEQPERFDTQRCQIGRPVTEAMCNSQLTVSYNWQPFSNQAGADLRYGRCSSNDIRGDRLSLPASDAYRIETTTCAQQGHGTGTEYRYWYRSCTGTETVIGYDATACSAPPNPASDTPAPKETISCTDAPRTADNCFTATGHFTTKADVPVFKDNWDNSACADLESHGAVIVN